MKKWLKGIDWRIALIAALFTAFIFQAKKNFFDDAGSARFYLFRAQFVLAFLNKIALILCGYIRPRTASVQG